MKRDLYFGWLGWLVCILYSPCILLAWRPLVFFLVPFSPGEMRLEKDGAAQKVVMMDELSWVQEESSHHHHHRRPHFWLGFELYPSFLPFFLFKPSSTFFLSVLFPLPSHVGLLYTVCTAWNFLSPFLHASPPMVLLPILHCFHPLLFLIIWMPSR